MVENLREDVNNHEIRLSVVESIVQSLTDRVTKTEEKVIDVEATARENRKMIVSIQAENGVVIGALDSIKTDQNYLKTLIEGMYSIMGGKEAMAAMAADWRNKEDFWKEVRLSFREFFVKKLPYVATALILILIIYGLPDAVKHNFHIPLLSHGE